MKKIEFKEYVKQLPAFLQKQEEQLYYVYGDKSYVLSNGTPFNQEYCIENDIDIIMTNHKGGTIVSSEKDIYIAFISPHQNNFGTRLCKYAIEKLKGKNINLDIVGNDILADGQYKVMASMKTRIGDMYYSAVGFFLEPDIELIKKICLKPMVKIPKGLNDYGITTDDIIEIVSTFTQEYKDEKNI